MEVPKKLEDWAVGLGFSLQDNSSSSQNLFASLTATPNRCQLWNTLMKSVQSKDKVEFMRKQLLVAKLKGIGCGKKTITDRHDILQKQNSLERLIEQKKNLIMKQENEILTKASVLLFKIFTLSELERQCEELKERTLILHLFTGKEKRLIKELEKSLLSIVGQSDNNDQRTDLIQKKLANLKNCCSDCEDTNCSSCAVTKELQEIFNTGITEESLWKEVISCKRSILVKLEQFSEEFSSKLKTAVRENEKEIQKKFQKSVTQLKKIGTEMSLQALVKEKEGELLNLEIQRLENLVLESQENSFARDPSILSSGGIQKYNQDALSAIKSHINVSAMNAYKKYLEDFLKAEEHFEKNEGKKMENDFDEEMESIVKTFNEIRSQKIKLQNQSEALLSKWKTYETLIREAGTELADESYMPGVEKAVANLKTSAERQIEIFVEMPLDGFRMLDTPPGSVIQEYEIPTTGLNIYGEKFKHFFSTMLISPYQTVDTVQREMEKRAKLVEGTQKFITEKEKLSASLEKVQSALVSIKCDRQLYQANFKALEKILENVLCRVGEIEKQMELSRQGLKNWVNQPYRLMLKESSSDGLSFKNYEENYEKELK